MAGGPARVRAADACSARLNLSRFRALHFERHGGRVYSVSVQAFPGRWLADHHALASRTRRSAAVHIRVGGSDALRRNASPVASDCDPWAAGGSAGESKGVSPFAGVTACESRASLGI